MTCTIEEKLDRCVCFNINYCGVYKWLSIEHQIKNTLWKSNFSISGVSTDIFIRVETLSVLSLALILVLMRFCLLKPLSQSTEDTGTVKAIVSNLSIWGNCSCISLELSSFFAIPWIDESLKFLDISCLKMTHSSFNSCPLSKGSSSIPLSVFLDPL